MKEFFLSARAAGLANLQSPRLRHGQGAILLGSTVTLLQYYHPNSRAFSRLIVRDVPRFLNHLRDAAPKT